jgi:hypothetical protein
VTYAVRAIRISAALLVLFVIALAIGVRLPGRASNFGDVAGNLVTLGFLVFFARKISTARNWARWTYAILTGLGTALSVYSFVGFPDIWLALPLAVRVHSWVQSLLQVGAAVMLFVPTSNAWFGRK